MDEKEIKSRTITLGEVWDILNKHDVPFNEAAQAEMIDASEPSVRCKVSVDAL